jgi:hypothetical protein
MVNLNLPYTLFFSIVSNCVASLLQIPTQCCIYLNYTKLPVDFLTLTILHISLFCHECVTHRQRTSDQPTSKAGPVPYMAEARLLSSLFFKLFYYSYMHTMLGTFLRPTSTISLTTHSAPSIPAETILPLSLILLKREYKQ